MISFEDGFLSRAQFMASETSITFLFMMIPQLLLLAVVAALFVCCEAASKIPFPYYQK